MKFFFCYLRTKWFLLVYLLLCVVLFLISFSLFHFPLSAVLYPSVLCLTLGAAFLLADYFRTRKRHRLLKRLASQPAELLPAELPTAAIPENDYAAIVRSLQKEITALRNADEEKYREMTDYYTVWAHQIKTPISAMKLMLQNEDSELSRRLSAELFRTQQYVDMVLAFLRLDCDVGDYVFRACTLDEIIRPAVRKFAAEFIGRKLSLTYEPITETVVTDEKWLSFVIEQLLSNALKYTKTGGIEIRMEQKTLLIRDTGIGIAPEDLPRIFEKGYTGYNGRTERGASGLGLYLCRRVCDNLNITIDIRSVLGEGTTVGLTFLQNKTQFE